jgi:peptide/nickel transport system substrate-binding protein/oligopeptide transport system substrate-binding protein
MRDSRQLPIVLIAAGLLALLAACGRKDQTIAVATISEAAPFRAGTRLNSAAQLIRSATTEGLVGFDDEGRVIPALADRWIVTDDGQSYIFRLRDGTWLDGSPLTAAGARASLLEAIGRVKRSAMELDLDAIAEVRAMAGRVIEIRLVRPMPDLLQLLAAPEMGLIYRGRGTGPMQLEERDGAYRLTPIPPARRGLPDEAEWDRRHRSVLLRPLPAEAALAQFDAGDVDVVLGGRFEDLPRVVAQGLSRGNIKLDPVAGLFGLGFVNAGGVLASPANREAIAMGIDRDTLVQSFNVGGWNATTRFVTPGLEGDTGTIPERWTGMTFAQRRDEATRRIVRWRAGRQLPALRIALPRGPGADLLFDRVATDLGAIGLTARRVPLEAAADIRMIDTAARYARPLWFFDQLSCTARRMLCDSASDALVARALTEADPAKRAERLAEAEAVLTRANTFVPLAAPIRWSLVRSSVNGFSVNRWAMHPLMAIATIDR